MQVERFYLSRRYQVGAVTVEPQMSVDAAYHQVTADRTQANLPAGAAERWSLFEPHGPLVNANRGLIEYADLLKRPLEAFKYLLGFSETGEVPLEHFVLQLDEVLVASCQREAPGGLQGAAGLRVVQGPHRAGARAVPAPLEGRSRRSTTRRSPPPPWASTSPPTPPRSPRSGRCSPA